MKKMIVIIAVLLALSLPLSALADTSVTLNNSVSTMGGKTTISWTGSAPAGGCCVMIEALNPSGNGSLLQLAGTSSSSSVITGMLAPDTTYQVYLLDSSFNILDMHEYTMPSVPVFEDGSLKNTSIKATFELRQSNLSRYKKVNSFRASDMVTGISAGSQYPCMKYQMRMPQLAHARTFFVQLVFETPDGCLFTDRAQDVTFDRVNNGYQTLWWDDAGIDFFNSLNSQTGSIPSGVYKIHLYWDGYWVNTSTFTVN